jgi:hypothetical protein
MRGFFESGILETMLETMLAENLEDSVRERGVNKLAR